MTPLVDYSSDYSSDSSSSSRSASAERPQDDAATARLPPLPAAFHDLYASTVRRSVIDDRSLHQGRRRQTPHVPGQWPTHVYIEWHPTAAQHETLEALVGLAAADVGGGDVHSALTSDLGAPLPLHISLSRPLSLATADREAFVARLTQAVQRGGRAFAVHPRALAWHAAADSGRSFLVLAVAGGGELAALLARCNAAAARCGQPALYAGPGGAVDAAALHVSLAWTLGRPGGGAARLLQRARFRGVRAWPVAVAGVKAKVGNVVTHIPLAP